MLEDDGYLRGEVFYCVQKMAKFCAEYERKAAVSVCRVCASEKRALRKHQRRFWSERSHEKALVDRHEWLGRVGWQ